MILIFGGAYQGKLEYALETFAVAPDDVFTICLNSYRASGTGGYDCYVGCPMVREIGTEMSDLILEYFKQYGDAIQDVHGDFQVLPAIKA